MRPLLRDPVLWVLVGLVAAMLLWHGVARGEPCWRAWVVAVVNVVDGDSVDLELSWEPQHTATERVRILGIDTPELRGPTRAAGLLAKAFTTAWLADSGPTEVIVCRPHARDNFGRLLGRIVSAIKGDLSAALLAAGHAVPYRP